MESTKCEPNRCCSVGGNSLKFYSNGHLLLLLAATEPANLPATRSLNYRLTAASLDCSPSTCLRQSPIISVTVILCPLPPNIPDKEFFWQPHSDRHPQPVHEAFLGYAQRERLARTLFYDFPVTPTSEMHSGHKAPLYLRQGPLLLTGRAASY